MFYPQRTIFTTTKNSKIRLIIRLLNLVKPSCSVLGICVNLSWETP